MTYKEYHLSIWKKISEKRHKSFMLEKYIEQCEYTELLFDMLQEIKDKDTDIDNKDLLISSFENVISYLDAEKEVLKELSK